MRGRPPKPTQLKKLHGTLRKDRARGVELPPGTPDRPPHIKGAAQKQWDRIVPQLVEHGMINSIDASHIEFYCTAYANWKKAQAAWDRLGPTIKTPFGVQANPAVKIAQKERSDAVKYGSLCGLDPSGRVRLKVPEKPKETDKTEDFLFGPKLVVSVSSK